MQFVFKKQGWTLFAAFSRSLRLTLPFGGSPEALLIRPERYALRVSENQRRRGQGAQHRIAMRCDFHNGSFLMAGCLQQDDHAAFAFSGGQASGDTLVLLQRGVSRLGL